MDKVALQDLVAYTGWAWDQIKAAVPDDKTLRATAPGSGWPALRNCLAHIVLAYDRWVPAIVDLHSRPMPDLAPDDFLTWPQIDTHRRRTRDVLQSHLDAWTEADLRERHEVDVDGDRIRYTRGERITHLLQKSVVTSPGRPRSCRSRRGVSSRTGYRRRPRSTCTSSRSRGTASDQT